ncbi:hypothetical protein DM02DRAFT_227447 [Periconia macrospinosa]|uniref:LYR motif-containing protein Cup1-like N-terminal domain-containing protein n=1 Tax=Periconia macrospinosa TaxID=97972 RepID=A0A2V1D5V4_9PLEO|nr:hypothetical protein DM02DRAFT_227447 [Periconia macrospinosa]
MWTASQHKSIHLLRDLLREASYLPDANARTYFRRYIINRFRAYQPKQNAATAPDARAIEKYTQKAFKRRNVSIIEHRVRPLQRKAQKGLNYLRRANLGEFNCLKKLLFFTYGRMGRRRYALQQKLLTPEDADQTTNTPAPLQKLYNSNSEYLAYFDAPVKKSDAATHYMINISDRFARLKAIVKSQHANNISLVRSLKLPYFKTPILNLWHRPMPKRRARNDVKRYYAEMMAQLLPPLPAAEWDAIKAMMEGTKHVGLVRRRTPADQQRRPEVNEGAAFAALVNKAIAMNKPSKADRPAGIQRPHTISVRFMRRMYTRIFPYCCKLEFDSERNKWIAVWGAVQNQIPSHIYSAPVAEDLFAGVDETGRKPKAPKTTDPDTQPTQKKFKKKFVTIPYYVDLLPKDHPTRVAADEYREWTRGPEWDNGAKAEGC